MPTLQKKKKKLAIFIRLALIFKEFSQNIQRETFVKSSRNKSHL